MALSRIDAVDLIVQFLVDDQIGHHRMIGRGGVKCRPCPIRSHHILGQDAGDDLAGAVPMGDFVGSIHHEQRHRTAVDDFVQALLFGGQRLQGLFFLGDVPKGFDGPGQIALGVVQGGGAELHPFAAIGKMRKKVLHFPTAGNGGRGAALAGISLDNAGIESPVHDQFGHDRMVGGIGIELGPHLGGADHIRSLDAADGLAGAVPVSHPVVQIDDESRYGGAVHNALQ